MCVLVFICQLLQTEREKSHPKGVLFNIYNYTIRLKQVVRLPIRGVYQDP